MEPYEVPAIALPVEDADIAALESLHAVLDTWTFWHPKTLGYVRPEVVEAFIDRELDRRPPVTRRIVNNYREKLRNLDAWGRACAVWGTLTDMKLSEASAKVMSDDPMIAWAAGLPAGFWSYPNPSEFVHREVSWLPADLHIPCPADFQDSCLEETARNLTVSGWLDLSGAKRLTTIRPGLWVGRNLVITGCELLKEVPEGVHVGGEVFLAGSPLALRSESELRALWDIHGDIHGLGEGPAARALL
jgi:hypothetical protein